jgi:C4-dicarboxylate-specific signal transduction histidine kinase
MKPRYLALKMTYQFVCASSQILVNLLGNALKFTAKGSVTVNVSINDTTATVAVTDTGVGISPDEMGKLFQPFSQACQDPPSRDRSVFQ